MDLGSEDYERGWLLGSLWDNPTSWAVARPLTKHSEDCGLGGAAGAGASLCHTVVGASIRAGGCRKQKVAAGSLEK